MKPWILLLLIACISCKLDNTKNNTDPATKKEFKDLALLDFMKSYTSETVGNAMLIDLRTPPEFEAGTINGAVMINFLDSDIDQQLDKLDRNKSYYVFCEQGARSKKCMDKMKGMGFKRVYNLIGGYNEMMGKK